MTDTPFLILGHRGCRNAAFQQNSMAAFREALAAADGLETDTAISRDGAIYLVHDITYIHTVDYTLAEHLDAESAARLGDRRIDQMESGEVETLRLKNGESLPRLDRLLELYRGYPDAVLNIELKSDNTVAPVVELVRGAIRAGSVRKEQIILSSFNWPALAWARAHAPEFEICALFALETQGRERLYPWSLNLESCYTPFRIRELETPLLRQIAPEFFNLSLATMSVANIAAIRAAYPRARFIVWALSEPSEAQAPYILELLSHLAREGMLHAWISDEPRLRKDALRAFSGAIRRT